MPPKKRPAVSIDDNENDGDDAAVKTKAKRKSKTSGGDKKLKSGQKNGGGDRSPISDYDEEEETEVCLEGSVTSGQLLICGGMNWDLTGRKSIPKGVKNLGGKNLMSPHRVQNFLDTRIKSVISGCSACHSVIIAEDGRAYSFGRNDRGQLGHGDSNRRDLPTYIEAMEGIKVVDASCGRNHTLFLSNKGHVYSCGENSKGQLGQGSQSQEVTTPARISYKGPPIRKLACGAEFSMIVDIRGNLYSFGLPEYGQLGHNSDGGYIEKSTKMSFSCESRPRKVQVYIEKSREGHVLPVNDVEIWDVKCGINHTIALDRKKRIYCWGFGGYGRLGHNSPKDDWVPRLVKTFDQPNKGVRNIAAGSSYTLAVSDHGQLYLWGQQKSSGEANMYPKPVQDLFGWNVRQLAAANRSVVVAADDSVISWGPSPTFGELGYGENKPKSSTIPLEVKTLDGIYIHSVACGYGHTLLIARADSEEEQTKINDLPLFMP